MPPRIPVPPDRITVPGIFNYGVWIRIGGTWKFAIPYIRIGNKWKQAVPYVRIGNQWKRAG